MKVLIKQNNLDHFQGKIKQGEWVEKGLSTEDLNEDSKLKEYNIEISRLTIRINETNNQNERAKLIDERNALTYKKNVYLAKLYLKKLLFYVFVFALLTFNIIVVAVSLSCSIGESTIYRVFSALCAFMFGILYLVINYKYYKLRTSASCVLQPNNPFAL